MNVAFISASQSKMSENTNRKAHLVMRGQLGLLGLTAHDVNGWWEGNHEHSFLVCYRTDHELAQIKRLAASYRQDAIMVLDNIRVLPEGTIANGGLQMSVPAHLGYYSGEHSEQLITFHDARPDTDCTLLPACFGGLYITIKPT